MEDDISQMTLFVRSYLSSLSRQHKPLLSGGCTLYKREQTKPSPAARLRMQRGGHPSLEPAQLSDVSADMKKPSTVNLTFPPLSAKLCKLHFAAGRHREVLFASEREISYLQRSSPQPFPWAKDHSLQFTENIKSSLYCKSFH